MLAGTLGGIIGSVFSGIHLARARSALSMLGPFGLISGLAGYTCFRSFDSFSSEAMLTDNNRREIVSGLLTPMLPYILLGRVLTTLGIPISGVVYGVVFNVVFVVELIQAQHIYILLLVFKLLQFQIFMEQHVLVD